MMRQFSILFWLCLANLAFLTPSVNAQSTLFGNESLFSNDDEFLMVDEAFQFDFTQINHKVSVNFTIAKGYYLYRHQFTFKTENADIETVVLPSGIDHEDEYFGSQKIFKTALNFPITVKSTHKNPQIIIRYQGCAEKGLCYAPTKKIIYLNDLTSTSSDVLSALIPSSTSHESSSKNPNGENVQSNSSSTSTSTPTIKVLSLNNKQSTNKSEQYQLVDMLKQDSLWLTLAAFFIGGLLLSFTPCVFPMYPILTGIIVGQGKNLTTKKAFVLSFFYVQGMAVTYTILGVVVALAGAQFQAAFQHPVVLIGLSILFVFLALSMFGVFNLALPSRWQNKLNDLSNNQKSGSIIGVIIMGVISGLVASPCTTAPLTGALIYISQSGDIILGASALYALSIGMGLPLLILGSSGGKLLPKAGAWMNIIKNIFGLLLLAVPIFLLERIVPATVTQILWIVLLLSASTYFYVTNKTTTVNFWYGVRSLLIFLALFYGAMQGYKLLEISFSKEGSKTTQNESNPQVNHPDALINKENEFIKVANLTELNLKIDQANAANKTVMVDLYADWCIACKEFERYTFSDDIVKEALKDTVLIQIDLTETGSSSSKELMKKFNVFGLPSILFFNKQGKELTQNRVTGFMDAENFSNLVNTIL